jgi:hypothetical protein
MVKRREPKAIKAAPPTADQIEAFAAGAEGGAGPVKQLGLDQTAIRDYKAIRVPFNEYEYRQLEVAAKLSGRTKLNFIRYAMLQLAKEVQEGGRN